MGEEGVGGYANRNRGQHVSSDVCCVVGGGGDFTNFQIMQ